MEFIVPINGGHSKRAEIAVSGTVSSCIGGRVRRVKLIVPATTSSCYIMKSQRERKGGSGEDLHSNGSEWPNRTVVSSASRRRGKGRLLRE